MSRTTQGFLHIVVIVCYLTKFVVARPLRTKTSTEILGCLQEIYLTFGVQKNLQHESRSIILEVGKSMIEYLQSKPLFLTSSYSTNRFITTCFFLMCKKFPFCVNSHRFILIISLSLLLSCKEIARNKRFRLYLDGYIPLVLYSLL